MFGEGWSAILHFLFEAQGGWKARTKEQEDKRLKAEGVGSGPPTVQGILESKMGELFTQRDN